MRAERASRLARARAWLLVAAALAVSSGCRSGSAPRRSGEGMRAVHISRDAWSAPHELIALVDGAARAGFDTIVFEDRRDGTSVHPSGYEPWSEHLNGVDPGWDPLAVALERARGARLGFLVAMQVVPVWSGAREPRDPEHPWTTHPAWRWEDSAGRRQALREGALVSFDPCLPEVRAHLTALLLEPLRRYPIDGIVLVDARYPNGHPSVPRGSNGDPPQGDRTRALYRSATGLGPEDDALAWQRWRAAQLTELVRMVRRGAIAIGQPREVPGALVHGADGEPLESAPPGPLVLAEVLPDASDARREQQDWRRWMDEGLIDAAIPIDDGERDPATLRGRNEAWRARRLAGSSIVPAVRVDPDDGGGGLEEWRVRIEAARAATGSVLVEGAEPLLANPDAAPILSGR